MKDFQNKNDIDFILIELSRLNQNKFNNQNNLELVEEINSRITKLESDLSSYYSF